MNFAKLAELFTPFNIIIVGNTVSFMTELNKKRYFAEDIYNILKEDTVKMYNEKLDESQEDPLIALLNERQNQLDPKLQKRL